MADDISKRMTREEFEEASWSITRWIQKLQREQGDKVIPDEVFAERLKKTADELFGTKN